MSIESLANARSPHALKIYTLPTEAGFLDAYLRMDEHDASRVEVGFSASHGRDKSIPPIVLEGVEVEVLSCWQQANIETDLGDPANWKWWGSGIWELGASHYEQIPNYIRDLADVLKHEICPHLAAKLFRCVPNLLPQVQTSSKRVEIDEAMRKVVWEEEKVKQAKEKVKELWAELAVLTSCENIEIPAD